MRENERVRASGGIGSYRASGSGGETFAPGRCCPGLHI